MVLDDVSIGTLGCLPQFRLFVKLKPSLNVGSEVRRRGLLSLLLTADQTILMLELGRIE